MMILGPLAEVEVNRSDYAGNYKGQFDCYTHALEAAGEHVIARYVYYPVTGMLIKI